MTFVFLHTGSDTIYPTIMVRSLRKHHPDARIVQLTDKDSPAIAGVTEVRRSNRDSKVGILFRSQCFADFEHDEPTVFLDTDMICLRPIDPVSALGNAEVAICQRSYELDAKMNLKVHGIDLSQYADVPLGKIYPYVGCFTVTKSPAFWRRCLDRYSELPEQFQKWFGDQEAIRDVIGEFKVKGLPERLYARLLDFDNNPDDAFILHFKGPRRKGWMATAAMHLGVMTKSDIENEAKAA